jgi:hypothetical protein
MYTHRPVCRKTGREPERKQRLQLNLRRTKQQGLSVHNHAQINSLKNKIKFFPQ